LAPGQRIPSERQLAQALDVGRSGVREAIKSLSLLGLLDVRQGAGTYLTSSTSELLPRVIEWGLLLGEPRVYDLTETRSHLEILVAGLAAERRTDADVRELRDIVDTMRLAGEDIAAYVEADVRFHLAVANASGNVVLANLVSSIQSLLRVWAGRVLESAGETETSLAMHVPIVDAIEESDADSARRAMSAHMDRANARLRAAVTVPSAAETNSG
jgi:GntR family transcriptional repressor for pyruvate dehydrogenase complex